MSSKWRFGGLEFLTLWGKATGEWLPHPFSYTSGAKYYYDHLLQQRAAAERMFESWDYSFDPVMDAIAHPDLRLSVSAEVNQVPKDGKEARRIRLVGVRSGSRGFIFRQLDGENSSDTGMFEICECDPIELANAVVAALPAAPAGGRGALDIERAGPRVAKVEEFGKTIVGDIFADSQIQRTEEFFAAATDGVGQIEIIQGYSKFGPRGIKAHRLLWRDLLDDGRYIISGDPPRAVAVDSRRMISAINVCVADVVQAIREERTL